MRERIRGRRIVLVIATSTGGVGRHVRSLAGGLCARGARVVVAGPAATEALFDFSGTAARFARVEIAPGIGPVTDARSVSALRHVLVGADLVHAHGLRAGLVAAVANAGSTRPLVVTWHNLQLGSGAKARLLTLAERVIARRATVALGASADLVARARRLGASDARLIEVSAPRLPPPTRTREAVRSELGADARPLVVAVGRLHPQKDYPTLVAAAARLTGRQPSPLVAVAGDGPERERLAALVAGSNAPVRLLGHREDVADLLAAADVVVLSSVWEARALIAQEALRAGRPLVATAVGGVPDLVGNAALLVPAGDPVALAAALTRVLDDPVLAAGLAASGSARAMEWPGEDATVDALGELYADVLGVVR